MFNLVVSNKHICVSPESKSETQSSDRASKYIYFKSARTIGIAGVAEGCFLVMVDVISALQ